MFSCHNYAIDNLLPKSPKFRLAITANGNLFSKLATDAEAGSTGCALAKLHYSDTQTWRAPNERAQKFSGWGADMQNLLSTLFSPVGRVRRRTYLLGVLGIVALNVGVMVALLFVYYGLAASPADGTVPPTPKLPEAIGGLTMLMYLSSAWALICLHIKRWQDRGKSWLHILIFFVPVIGGFWTLIECGFLDGDQGQNKYGPSPKGVNRLGRNLFF